MDSKDILHGFKNRRQKRLLMEGEDGIYHVVTRTSCRHFLFKDDLPKEVFVKLLWKQAVFSGVEVLSYCVMSNHIHLLVRVPYEKDISDKELIRRYGALYNKEYLPPFTLSLKRIKEILKEGGADAEALREKLKERMGSLPHFMRELKQRFSMWYNRHYNNKGTIWSERYRSLLVEPSEEAMAAVAAYIELNPIRAEMVTDPGAYRFCSYAEAMGGSKRMRAGICFIFKGKAWKSAVSLYRLWIYNKGFGPKGEGVKDRGKLSESSVRRVNESEGSVPLKEALHCRLRYFSDGLILGSSQYLKQTMAAYPDLLRKTQKTNPRKLKQVTECNLSLMRNG